MARLKDMAERVTDLLQVDPRKIVVEEGYNIRTFEPETDEEDRFLKESIRSVGVRTPLTVRGEDGKLVVVAGHRRLAACMSLIGEGVEILTVPCMPEIRGTTVADRDLDLLISNGSKQLTPMQKAVALKRLIGHGWSEEQIADRSGLKLREVGELLDLLGADKAITDMVDKGALTPSVAVKTIKQQGKKAVEVIKEAAAEVKKAGGTGKKVSAAQIRRVVHPEMMPRPVTIHGRRINSKTDLTNTLREILGLDEIEEVHKLVRVRLGMDTGLDRDGGDDEAQAVLDEYRMPDGQELRYEQEEITEGA